MQKKKPRNSTALNSIKWRLSNSNVAQIGHQEWRLRTEIHSRPFVKYKYRRNRFSRKSNVLDNFLQGTHTPNFMKIRQTVQLLILSYGRTDGRTRSARMPFLLSLLDNHSHKPYCDIAPCYDPTDPLISIVTFCHFCHERTHS